VTANTYTHVLVDETDIDYAALVSRWRQFNRRLASRARHCRTGEGGDARTALLAAEDAWLEDGAWLE
jgi:hypothetical protein